MLLLSHATVSLQRISRLEASMAHGCSLPGVKAHKQLLACGSQLMQAVLVRRVRQRR